MTDPPRRPRIAYLSWSSGRYDARTQRMARSALDAGFEVVVYARREPGLPTTEQVDGYRIVRAPFGFRIAWRAFRASLRGAGAAAAERDRLAATLAGARAGGGGTGAASRRRRFLQAAAQLPILRLVAVVRTQVQMFPIRPYAWGASLEALAEPADIWHGMWAGSLPGLARVRSRFGGRTIYDSRDVYFHSRIFGRLPGFVVAPFRWLERRWARRVDAVITVNDAYADILRRTLGVRIAAVIRNTPLRYAVPDPRPDLLRERLGLPGTTRVVLYQGQLTTERGIEQTMDAIAAVPDAVLVLLGFGALRDKLAKAVGSPPYRGRVFLLDPVPPSALLDWTASADVSVMAIQPTTLNHRHTTPQKLWESLAAGTPIVAGDLPGMAAVIRETGGGVLCDPTSPASIAAAIREVLDGPPERTAEYRRRATAAARDRYNWESESESLLDLYRSLLALDATTPVSPRHGASATG